MTMLTVSICVGLAALGSLAIAKAAADARAKSALVPVKAKRRIPRVAAVLAAIAVAAVGSAFGFTSA